MTERLLQIAHHQRAAQHRDLLFGAALASIVLALVVLLIA
jgi:hypothetical protein